MGPRLAAAVATFGVVVRSHVSRRSSHTGRQRWLHLSRALSPTSRSTRVCGRFMISCKGGTRRSHALLPIAPKLGQPENQPGIAAPCFGKRHVHWLGNVAHGSDSGASERRSRASRAALPRSRSWRIWSAYSDSSSLTTLRHSRARAFLIADQRINLAFAIFPPARVEQEKTPFEIELY